ncbi:succinylglutamate desuccinylase/aspartoacylase family protein [Haloarchaeobius amylolyticus]|uniref:succinylglutamate desuccinylase/aspartoacylase family protein n=1 Tax=Haloarchaeobius amylolyticus TaxID=1198296 RepID=UPI00226E3AFF|nr:succinylglutamate desuccinylase/aspartoacylase family protein [Haloarchaeobius amylolyticus]
MTRSARHRRERVTLARLPSGVEVTTTVHSYEGPAEGPTVYVQAAQHGREINGTEVCRRLHDELPTTELRGRVVVVPVANPLTFDRISYTTPEVLDSVNPNMNRVWPGTPTGSVHQRMAAALWEYAGEADAIVDLHTGSPDMQTHTVFMEGDPASRDLAEVFGTDLLLAEQAGDGAPESWHRRGFDGKLRVVAAREDIPAITPELAHNKQIVEDAVRTGVRGVLNVLRSLDVLDGQVIPTGEPRVARNHLGRVDAKESGLFRPAEGLALGQTIAEGDHLGVVYDPTTYEVLQRAESTRDGILYAITREATVKGGDRLASVAVPLEE